MLVALIVDTQNGTSTFSSSPQVGRKFGASPKEKRQSVRSFLTCIGYIVVFETVTDLGLQQLRT